MAGPVRVDDTKPGEGKSKMFSHKLRAVLMMHECDEYLKVTYLTPREGWLPNTKQTRICFVYFCPDDH